MEAGRPPCKVMREQTQGSCNVGESMQCGTIILYSTLATIHEDMVDINCITRAW